MATDPNKNPPSAFHQLLFDDEYAEVLIKEEDEEEEDCKDFLLQGAEEEVESEEEGSPICKKQSTSTHQSPDSFKPVMLPLSPKKEKCELDGRERDGRNQADEPTKSSQPKLEGMYRRGGKIHEIYANDDDLPEDLRETILEVSARREQALRRRKARAAKDESSNANECGDSALFVGEEDALQFDWRSMDSYICQKETFLHQQTGPTAVSKTAYDAFRQYWNNDILEHIVTETNRYAATKAFNDWYDTNVHEILVLFSFWMMLAVIQMPSIKSCFSDHPLLTTHCFRLMFSRTRYVRLCSVLNFNNDSLQTSKSSAIFPIEPIVSHLNNRFKKAYVPSQNICIDESLTVWKGNLSFKQYIIKNNITKSGIKTLELCESATGYMWSFCVYTGKSFSSDLTLPSSLLVSTASVIRLIRPLLNQGYTLFTDNWFDSLLLARYLKRNKTDVVSSLKTHHQFIPPLINEFKLKPGQFVARHAGDMMIMAYQDKKKICLLSTCHGKEAGLTAPSKTLSSDRKPQVLLDYTKGMGGVNLKDSMLSNYLVERKKCAKWHIKFFKRLLNCSIFNSRICVEASTKKRYEQQVFRLELVEQILNHHLSLVPKPRQPVSRPKPTLIGEDRFTENRHWPAKINGFSLGVSQRRRCAHCKKLSTYQCRLCDVGLCVDPCFGLYHTRP